ncbi:uncharacterized protein N7459_007603 [Penicillium hispanicum]|uniref:uncharacterized protein n=1 Tax=Penicillium hispanicum TaxID=1080232 RepID=UPI0025406F7F|nr:uncharacterized protein N7459_007603 [Penicillium hispanicum]KAJ5578639.1 hypothetical protein N7459_007603 [Penicillium hispanicum]
MARLNDDGEQDPGAQPSDHILSPQPCAPPSKELLLASFETSHLPASENRSTIDDGQMSTRDYEYNSSGSSTRHSSSDIFGREMDDELEQMKSRASSRSSLSSMPASVLVHPLTKMNSMNVHEKVAGYNMEDDEASFGGFDEPPISIRTVRQREAAFRKPSSVRAMQMHTEDEADDDEYLTPPRRRPGMRSPGSSPLKRSPYYSPNASSNKPKPKKEYPLVLLHCNLLAPSLPVSGAADPVNQELLEQVLPTPYWKRWRRLQDKVGSGVLRDRGVLISHPEDLYDVLEERLLESLELQRPRVHQGHFIGHEESGPGSEGELSDRGESETDGEQGDECPDCGGRVLRHGDNNRKWEIRVYAANGLMRAGAWAAAWKDMEKVDVEVGLWLPSDVRRALEKRLAEERQAAPKQTQPAPMLAETEKPDMTKNSVLGHGRSFEEAGSAPSGKESVPADDGSNIPEARHQKQEHEIALQTLIINYIRVLAGDKRNIALVVMSILVAFLAIGSRPQLLQPSPSTIYPFSPEAVNSVAVPILNSAVRSQPTVILNTPSPSTVSPSIVSSDNFMTDDTPTSIAEGSTPVAESMSSSSADSVSSSSAESMGSFSIDQSPSASEIAEPEATSLETSSKTEVEPSDPSEPEASEVVEPESPAVVESQEPDAIDLTNESEEDI